MAMALFRPPDGSYVSEPHVCVVVADRCSLQLFVAVGGTPSSASVNLPPLFCEACLFILCRCYSYSRQELHPQMILYTKEMSKGHHDIRL